MALLRTMVSVRSRKRRESEFPPTEESGLETPPTEDNHTEEITFPEEIHVDGGVSSLYPFLFLLLKQQKPGNLYASQRPFRCMLFNNFNIYCLKNV